MYCTEGLGVAKGIFATIAMTALQNLSPTMYRLSTDVDFKTDNVTCLESLDNWLTSTSGGDQCPAQDSTCQASVASTAANAPSLNATQKQIICDAAGNRQCDEREAGSSHTVEIPQMQCGLEVNIFTNLHPDDLWAIAALFSQATKLDCSPPQYPIKHVFGGGGWDAVASLSMLQEFLRRLQVYEAIVPWSFDIFGQTHPGPADVHTDEPQFNSFYNALDIVPFPDKSTLFETAFQSAKEPLVMASQTQPIMLLLRPVEEFVIHHTNYLLGENVIDRRMLQPTFLIACENHRVTAADANRMMEIWKRSVVVSTQQYPNASTFLPLMAESFEGEVSRQLSAFLIHDYVDLPRRTILLNPHTLFLDPDGDPRIPPRSAFSDRYMPPVFRVLDTFHPEFRNVFRGHAQNWNRGKLQGWIAELRDIVGNLDRQHHQAGLNFLHMIEALQPRLNALAAKIRNGQFHDDDRVAWRAIRLRSLVPAYHQIVFPNDDIRAKFYTALMGWSLVVLEVESRVSEKDVLLPLVFEAGTIVRENLRPVRHVIVTRNVSGTSDWMDDPAGKIWIPSVVLEPEPHLERVKSFRNALAHLYFYFWTSPYI